MFTRSIVLVSPTMKLNLEQALLLCFLSASCVAEDTAVADLLLIGGQVIDGSGSEPLLLDIAVTADRISFLGEAAVVGVDARP